MAERVYCASKRAIEAGARAGALSFVQLSSELMADALADALIAAHHPDLGLDRSVCLRDVVEALDRAYHPKNPTDEHPVDFINRAFKVPGA